MKPRLSNQRETAMTLFEVGVIVAVLLLLLALFLPALGPAHRRASRVNCINNQRQIGLAFRIWEGDNGDIFPMGISITNGGSMEMAATGNVAQSFLVMSNELSTPKVLVCQQDTNRFYAAWFAGLANSNISYFVGVDITNDMSPQLIIGGDCNFEFGGAPVKPGLVSWHTNDPVVWSTARHVKSGNIGLADGSVQTVTDHRLHDHFVETSVATNRLAIP